VARRCVSSRNIKNGCFIYIYIYIYDISSLRVNDLTLILLTWKNDELLIMPTNSRWDLIQHLKG